MNKNTADRRVQNIVKKYVHDGPKISPTLFTLMMLITLDVRKAVIFNIFTNRSK